jgi:hypothetical protein
MTPASTKALSTVKALSETKHSNSIPSQVSQAKAIEMAWSSKTQEHLQPATRIHYTGTSVPSQVLVPFLLKIIVGNINNSEFISVKSGITSEMLQNVERPKSKKKKNKRFIQGLTNSIFCQKAIDNKELYIWFPT